VAPVDVVVDVCNTRSQDEAQIVDFFGTVTGNLLAAEDRVGVGHHVLLSIVGIDHDRHVPHYAGKREQERRVMAGPIPWSIVRSTQFHDFAAMVAGWTLHDGTATIALLLVQPIAQQEVGEILAEVATGAPLGSPIDIAGPETQDLVDMARRTFAARGEQVRLVPTWRGLFDTSMAGEVLLPGDGARLGNVTPHPAHPTPRLEFPAVSTHAREPSFRLRCHAPPGGPRRGTDPRSWGRHGEACFLRQIKPWISHLLK
jgi:uncharacterized protein YbjT (DUF2867 family)